LQVLLALASKAMWPLLAIGTLISGRYAALQRAMKSFLKRPPTYRVSRIEIADPTDVSVLKSHGQNELTLVTCYPFSYLGRAPKRFIVHSVIAP
jgi:Sortase domain